MSRLFKRVARVTAWREVAPSDPTSFKVARLPNATEITGHQIKFKIVKDLSKHPNSCEVTITNLSDHDRHDLETLPLVVQLEAGYDDVPRLLFLGDLRFGMSEIKGATWDTLLQLGDGDCHHRWSRVNKSYGRGTKVRTVLTDVAASYGLALPAGLANDKTLDEQFSHGHMMTGFARDELEHLLAPYGYTYSTQNGVLQILRDDEVASGQALPVDEEHGMIETPQYGSPPKAGKPPHMNVKMELYPEMAPGIAIKLASKDKNGFFRVERVEHNGDTHGKPWTTTLEIKPIDASVQTGDGKPVQTVLFGPTGAPGAVFTPDDLF